MPGQTAGQSLPKLRAILSAVGVAGLVLVANEGGWVKPLQNSLEDFRFWASPRPASDSLVIVQIDPAGISHIGPWPWARGVHAEIIDKLRSMGASDIALDIDFSSPSQPQEDEQLTAALRRAGGTVILPAFKQATFAADGTNAAVASLPIPELAAHSWTASVNVLADADGKVRRIAASDSIGQQTIPALAVMLAGLASEEQSFRIDYGIDPSTFDRMSVSDLLQDKVATHRIKNKKVIVGATAIELRDYLLVPVHGFISGAMFHALAAETLLQNRAPSAPGFNVIAACLALATLLGSSLLARKGWLWTLGAILGAAAAVESLALGLYSLKAVLIDTASIQCLLIGVGLVALVQEIDIGKLNLWLARTEARNLRAVLSQVVTDNFDGIIVADIDGNIEASSAQAAAILALPPHALQAGNLVYETLPEELSKTFAERIEQFRRGRSGDVQPAEFVYNHDGAVRILEYVVTPSRLKSEGGVWRRQLVDRYVACLTFRDITEQRRLEQETFRLARYSQLTGLPNRNLLEERLRRLQQSDGEHARAAVMLLDIDRFRSINRTLGHDYGDMLLRAVASRITSLSGEVKFAAHLGGDDFAVLIDGWSTREELSEITHLLLFAMSQPYTIDMRQLHVSFSAGVFISSSSTRSPIEALMMADNALLAAKQCGGGSCKFHEEAITAKLADRQAIEIDLWPALDKQQFSVSYQPQVNLETNAIVGAEALLRWNHPTRGTISPAEFIPIAEVTGMILPIGRWVLERACRDAAGWPGGCKVAVNLSNLQLTSGDLIGDLKKTLTETDLASERLELEITESVFMQDAPQVIQLMYELKRNGIDLSIDDFGTGYSSLSYLSSFPFNKIKIDKSFVAKLDMSETSRAIVRTIISLAQRIGAGVIAEGVETLEQARILQLLGCRWGQGYYYGRALSADDFHQTLLQNPPGDPSRGASSPAMIPRANAAGNALSG